MSPNTHIWHSGGHLWCGLGHPPAAPCTPAGYAGEPLIRDPRAWHGIGR